MTKAEWAGTLAERGADILMNTYGRYPLELAGGRGCVVWDSSGNQYLDFVAGIAVNALGHAHPAVIGTIRDACEGLIHVSNLYWTEPMVRLAERLTAVAGMERAFFCNSGAEAIEAAIKMARKARPGRPRTVCFEHSFHGRTFGALSITSRPAYQKPFRPLMADVTVLPWGDENALAGIDGRTAAVFVEAVQGEGGVRPAPSGWLAGIRRRCDEAGALMVVDEVQTGIGRTGTFFAFQSEGIFPDAVASAKALAGGLPMGALLARGAAAEAFTPGDHASTFGGGPMVASVANAVLDVVLEPGFLEGVREKGTRLGDGLRRIAAAHPAVVEARGRGLLWGLVLSRPRAAKLVESLQGMGLLTVPAGPDVLRFAPPLVVTNEEIDACLVLVERALTDQEKEG
ncbi:MAG: acetylornithine transaminase [Deltaproteobacteria bacterium]|nr:acetylornithine transaminase [Deltaproteobacteria bacterium]